MLSVMLYQIIPAYGCVEFDVVAGAPMVAGIVAAAGTVVAPSGSDDFGPSSEMGAGVTGVTGDVITTGGVGGEVDAAFSTQWHRHMQRLLPSPAQLPQSRR